MADWSKRANWLSETWSAVQTLFGGFWEDAITWLEGSSSTNLPTNSKRWNNSTSKFENWTGTVWEDLAALYAINVDKLDGSDASAFAPVGHVGATGTAHGNATGSVAGFMSATDKTLFDAPGSNPVWCGTATGTANALVLTPSPAITAYAPGQAFIFKSSAAGNTGNTVIAVSGLTNITAQFNGVACIGGEIQPNKWYRATLDSTITCQIESISGSPQVQQLQAGKPFYYVASGINTIAATPVPALTAYADGQSVRLKSASSNTGATTLNLNGLGALTVTTTDGNALVGGEIVANGIYDIVCRSGTSLELLNPSPAVFNWTPVLTFATPGNLSVAYTTQVGRGVKIGRKVTLSFTIVTSTFTHTTASGALRITGSPLTALAATGHEFHGAISFSGVTKALTSLTNAVSRIVQATAIIDIVTSQSGGGRLNVTAADMPTGGAVMIVGQIEFLI